MLSAAIPLVAMGLKKCPTMHACFAKEGNKASKKRCPLCLRQDPSAQSQQTQALTVACLPLCTSVRAGGSALLNS
eukprot:70199-Amphidinium_carterae.1